MPEQARFIVLEGLDGAGTTTQAGRLQAALRDRGVRAEGTSEPSEGPIGRVLREHIRGTIDLSPEAAALAFTADRADHLARLIRPTLHSGRWVVCDRYLLSTLAYQGAEGVDPEWVLDASRGFDVPDLTLLLDVPTDRLADRLASRAAGSGEGPDRYERPELAARLRDAYLTAADLLRKHGHRVVTIPGDRSIEEVSEQVLDEVATLRGSDTTQRGGVGPHQPS